MRQRYTVPSIVMSREPFFGIAMSNHLPCSVRMCCGRSPINRPNAGPALRTTSPIESTFSTVRLRTKVTRGAGYRAALLAMTFKLIESRFERGVLVKCDEYAAA
ncbi:hypothetical protein GCM10009734_45720 [Nonomuraea bangladeshensis]